MAHGGLSHQKNQNPIALGPNWRSFSDGKPSGPTLCFAGGVVKATTDPNAGTHDLKKGGNGGAISFSIPHSVVDGVRVIDVADGLRTHGGGTPFTFKNLWVTYTRADCIENDAYNGGLIEDSLFDGCFTPYSATNPDPTNAQKEHADGGKNTVIFRDNLMSLVNMPTPYDGNKIYHDEKGFGEFFKF